MTITEQHEPATDPRDDLERLEDQYQEVARAMGCRTFFHADVLERARELRKYWEKH